MKLKSLIMLSLATLLSLPFAASADMVNINDATAAAMSHHLKGIGRIKAKSIVEFREANGDFKNIDDLVKVRGVGKGLIKKNRGDLSLTEGVVVLIKEKPRLVVLDKTSSTELKSNNIDGKKLVPKVASKGVAKRVKNKKVVNLDGLSTISSKKKESLNKIR